jgi:hypothetical protein
MFKKGKTYEKSIIPYFSCSRDFGLYDVLNICCWFCSFIDTAVSRAVSDVATAALADTSATQGGDYRYVVDENAETPAYSPYTAAQREMIATLVKK